MSNIKGLYFKLNIDKSCDKEIYNFFIQESKKQGIDKITLLYEMIYLYKDVQLTQQLIISKRPSNFDFEKIFKEVKK